jgi:hypothetical protein
MHLVRIDTVSLDEGEAAVDLGQAPGDLVVLSFTDSDLAGIGQAGPRLPSPACRAYGSPSLPSFGIRCRSTSSSSASCPAPSSW